MMRTSQIHLLIRLTSNTLLLFASTVMAAGADLHRDTSNSTLSGVNIENPQWMSPQQQDIALGELKAAHVRVVRFPLVPSSGSNFSSIVTFTKSAFRLGISSVVIVSPSFGPNAVVRPAITGTLALWPIPALSSADPDLFTRTYQPVISQLDKDGVVLAGFELANEINWPQYNGDFPVPGTGLHLSSTDLEVTPLGRRIASGFYAYLATLAELRSIRDNTIHNRPTPVVLAGLAEAAPSPSGTIDAVDIDTTIDFLRAHGLDHLVDIYGVHTYAAEGVMVDDAEARSRIAAYLQSRVLARCRLGTSGKPCWITEWGGGEPSTSCPFVGERLALQVRTFLAAIKPAIDDGQVTGLFYANWGDAASRGLYRCGRMTEAGHIVLDFAAQRRIEPISSQRGEKR